MKRFLLPLLAALALPTAVNAEATYLTCDLNDNPKKVDITLNQNQGKVTYIYPNSGSTWTVPAQYTNTAILFSTDIAKWQLDRTNGKIYVKFVLSNGSVLNSAEGNCKKAEKTKTLF